jgi:hypothetical protein
LTKKIRDEAIEYSGKHAQRLHQLKMEQIAENKKIALKKQMKVFEKTV